MTLSELLEKYKAVDFTTNPVAYQDKEGKVYYKQEEAIKSGAFVKLINLKDGALEDLKKTGINKAEASQIINILNAVYDLNPTASTSSPTKSGKRRTFSDAEKGGIIAEWEQLQKEGSKKTKAAFARDKEVGYQTFIKWIS